MEKPKVHALPWQSGPGSDDIGEKSAIGDDVSDGRSAPEQPAASMQPADGGHVSPAPPSPSSERADSASRASSSSHVIVAVLSVVFVCLLVFSVFALKPITNLIRDAWSSTTTDTNPDSTTSSNTITDTSTSSPTTPDTTATPQTPIAGESDKGLFSNSSDDDAGSRGTGEIIPTWNDSVSYTCTKETYDNVTTTAGDPYDGLDFAISYPQVQNLASGQQDAVNALIKDKALRWATRMYLDPDPSVQSVIDEASQGGKTYIASHVTSYITYNDEHLLSIAFVDHYFMGSIYGEFLDMRTLNVNLDTGEAYTIDDILEPDESTATQWLADTKNEEDGGDYFTKEVSASMLTKILQNDDRISNRYFSNFFVDGNKSIEIGVTYHFKSNDGDRIAHGWAAEAFTPSSLSSIRKPSAFWALIGA